MRLSLNTRTEEKNRDATYPDTMAENLDYDEEYSNATH